MSGPAEIAPVPGAGAVDPDFWQAKRVLLTGHTGFKGAWLSLWLQSLGADVTGLSAGVPTNPCLFELARVGDGMQSVMVDVRDMRALSDAMSAAAPQIVIHMAAQPLVRRSFQQPRETYEINVMGTVNVLEATRQLHSARVAVVVTSDKCYANQGALAEGYSEEAPLGGHDPYSSSKACAELVVAAYRDSLFAGQDAPRLASARAGNVIGGGDWGEDRLLPDLMRAALDDREVRVRNPGSVRPWQHVLCPLSGYLVLAQALWSSPSYVGAWNFGPADEDAVTVESIVQRVAGRWPGGLVWASDETPGVREAAALRLNSTKARGSLGWRPPLALDAAIGATVEWFREFRAGADVRALTLDQIQTLV